MVSALIGVCGRSASGKTLFAKKLREELVHCNRSVGVLSMDDFYRELSEEERALALKNEFDFDCLEAFDLVAFRKTLEALRGDDDDSAVIEYYGYDLKTHQRKTTKTVLEKCDIWIVEGLYLFAVSSCIVDLFDLRVFMEIDADVSLLRRVRRDIVSRGRCIEDVLSQYERYVKPAYDLLVQPSRNKADICIMRGAYNERGVKLVLDFCRKTDVCWLSI